MIGRFGPTTTNKSISHHVHPEVRPCPLSPLRKGVSCPAGAARQDNRLSESGLQEIGRPAGAAAPADAVGSAPRPVWTAPHAPNAETGARPQHHSAGRRWLIVAGLVGGVCLLGICVLVGSALFGSSTSTHQAVTSNAPPPTPTVADNMPTVNPDRTLTPGSPPPTPTVAGSRPRLNPDQGLTPHTPPPTPTVAGSAQL